MKKFGYVKIFRKIKNKEYYKNSKYIHVWLHLLLTVNYEEKSMLWNNKILKIKPGQLLTSRPELSKETGIRSSTVEDILRHFEGQQQIRQQKFNKFRVITIVNWKLYQQKKDKFRQVSRHQADTTKELDKELLKKREKILFELKDWNNRQSRPIPHFIPLNIINKHGPEKIEKMIKLYGQQNGGFGEFLRSLKYDV